MEILYNNGKVIGDNQPGDQGRQVSFFSVLSKFWGSVALCIRSYTWESICGLPAFSVVIKNLSKTNKGKQFILAQCIMVEKLQRQTLEGAGHIVSAAKSTKWLMYSWLFSLFYTAQDPYQENKIEQRDTRSLYITQDDI